MDKQIIANAPTFMGVYIMLDSKSNTLYIGKAKNIAKRLQGHLQHSQKSQRHAVIMNEVKNIEYIQTTNEEGAFLLEAKLIQQRKPLYNIAIKTDGRIYLVIDSSEKFPRLHIKYISDSTPKNLSIFGPFANKRIANSIASNVHETFKLRSCHQHQFSKGKLCIEYDLGRCSGPCVGKITEENYSDMVEFAKELLSGRDSPEDSIKQLENRMKLASKAHNFKQAIQYRDTIRFLSLLPEKYEILNANSTDYVICVKSSDLVGLEILSIRYGVLCIALTQSLDLRYTLCSWQEIALSTIVQFYKATEETECSKYGLKKVVLCESAKLLNRDLSRILKVHFKIVTKCNDMPDRILSRIQHLLVEIAPNFYSDKIHNLAISKLKEITNLPLINIAEVYDNSHWGGEFAIGSFVSVNLSGHKLREIGFYVMLKEKISTQDDLLLMRKTLEKRIQKSMQVQASIAIPEVIVIDGGIGQFTAAHQTLKTSQLFDKTAILSVAKGDDRSGNKKAHTLRIKLLNGKIQEISIKPSEPICKLLFQLLTLAHNKAIRKHRNWSEARFKRKNYKLL